MKKTIILASSLMLVASLNAKVLATMDGKDITSGEVNKMAQLYLGGKDVLTLPASAQKRMVEMYVVRKAILKKAKEEKLENSKLYKELMATAKDNALSEAYQSKVFQSIKISDIDAKKYYNLRKDAFVLPARINTRQVVLKSSKEAKEAIKSLKGLKGPALERAFIELANTKSINKNISDLGWITVKSLPKGFSSVLLKLKDGQYNKKPLKSEYGYHVFLKEAYEDKKQLSFAQVKADIKASMANEKFNEIMAKTARGIIEKADIKFK